MHHIQRCSFQPLSEEIPTQILGPAAAEESKAAHAKETHQGGGNMVLSRLVVALRQGQHVRGLAGSGEL